LDQSFANSDVELGEGGYGTVRLCEEQVQGQPLELAVKRIQAQKFFPSEVYYLQKFSRSPFGIELFGCQVTNNYVYIAQHRAPYDLGNPLVTQAFRTRFSLKRRVIFFRKLMQLLASLQTYRIFHGDIKPPNIGLDDDYNPLLLDYDSASPLNGLANDHASSIYSSPKRIKHQQALPIYDLYSMMWVILAMENPYGQKGLFVYRIHGETNWRTVPPDCWTAERDTECRSIFQRVVEGSLAATWGQPQSHNDILPLNLSTLVSRIVLELWEPSWEQVDQALAQIEAVVSDETNRVI